MTELGFTWANLLAYTALLFGIYRAWSTNSVKIAKLENDYITLKERLERENKRTEESFKELKCDIKEIYNKIDEIKDLIIELKK